jgi:cytochrome c-type biogenesis protein
VEPVQGVTILLAVSAGVLSFLSPCVLPLVPSYLAFLSGVSGPAVDPAASPRATPARAATLVHAGLFIAGFSLVFIALGASFSLLGQVVFQSRSLLQKVGGVLIIVLGLSLAGVLRLPFLHREWRVHMQARPAGYVGSLLVGVTFASGWVPCIGPVLGSILTLAGTAEGAADGITMLAAYAAGLGVPFFLSALALDRFNRFFERFRQFLPLVDRVAGVVLVAVGVLLFTGAMTSLNAYFIRLTPEWLWERL